MQESQAVELRYARKEGFVEGVAAERARLIGYLVEKAIIRRDAFNVWVRETMGDQVTDLDDLEPTTLPKRADAKIFIHPTEIGAMMVRNNKQHDEDVKARLFKLREQAPAGSEVSLAITKWITEIV
jgi:hypothetical protein